MRRTMTGGYGVLLVCATYVATSAACAPEKSAEERRREQEHREVQRLEIAEGSFVGHVLLPSGGAVPFAIDMAVEKNADASAGKNIPELTAKARLGLFEGTELVADAVTFDAGAHALTATFKSGGDGAGFIGGARLQAPAGSKTLELQAIVGDEGLAEARLVGSGGAAYQVTAARSAQSGIESLAEGSYDFALEAKLRDPEQVTSMLLTIKRVRGSTASPASSDLPSLPRLEGSMRFQGTTIVAQRAATVEYDALADTLQLTYLGGNSAAGGLRLSFADVSQRVATDGAALTFRSMPTLTGTLMLNGVGIGEIDAGGAQLLLTLTQASQALPPLIYVGTLKSAASQMPPIKAIAKFDYSGGTNANSAEYPFTSFPDLTLTVTECFTSGRYSMKVRSFDFLRNRLVFQNTRATANEELSATFAGDWSSMEGDIRSATSGTENPTSDWHLTLKAVPGATTIACSGISH